MMDLLESVALLLFGAAMLYCAYGVAVARHDSFRIDLSADLRKATGMNVCKDSPDQYRVEGTQIRINSVYNGRGRMFVVLSGEQRFCTLMTIRAAVVLALLEEGMQ